MPDRLDFQISWPGVESPTGVRYCNSHGITPGRATLRCNPQDGSTIAEFGDLVFQDGGEPVVIPDCRLMEMVEVPSGEHGFEWELTIEDRRWRWYELGDIQGMYNQLDPHGKLIGWTIKSPSELVELCLGAMNEERAIVNMPFGLDSSIGLGTTRFLLTGFNFPPTGTNPPINWASESPAPALQRLCEIFGRRIIYNPLSNVVSILPIGLGNMLPIDNSKSIASISPTLKSPKLPDGIKVIGAPNRYQSRFRLEPVGLEWDRSLKSIDLLSYAPTGGGTTQNTVCRLTLRNENGLTTTLPGVSGAFDVTVRGVNKNYVYPAGTTATVALNALAALINGNTNLKVTATVSTTSDNVARLSLAGNDIGDSFTVETMVHGQLITNDTSFTNEITRTAVPTGRSWTYDMPPTFSRVQATERLTYEQAVELAKESVWRYYRITNEKVDDTGDHFPVRPMAPLQIPGFGDVVRIQQVHLLDTMVDQVEPERPQAGVLNTTTLDGQHILNYYNGYSRDVPAVVWGSYCAAATNGNVFPDIDSVANSAHNKKVYVPFKVDPGQQLIIFDEPVFKLGQEADAGGTQPVREITRVLLRSAKDFPNGPTYVAVQILGTQFSVTDATTAGEALKTLADAINAHATVKLKVTARAVVPAHTSGRHYLEILGSERIPLNVRIVAIGTSVTLEHVRRNQPATAPLVPSTAAPVAAPTLILETSCHVRGVANNSFMRFELRRDFGQGAQTNDAVQRRDDVQLEITSSYDIVSDNVHRLRSFGPENMDFMLRANHALNAMELQYRLKDAQVVQYNGLEVIELDGAICQATWIIDENGSKTIASRNTESDIWTPSYPARRRAELDPAIVRQVERRQNRITKDAGVINDLTS